MTEPALAGGIFPLEQDIINAEINSAGGLATELRSTFWGELC